MTNRDKCHRKERNQDNYKKQKNVLYCFVLYDYAMYEYISHYFSLVFLSLRLVFSKVLFILMFRVGGKRF